MDHLLKPHPLTSLFPYQGRSMKGTFKPGDMLSIAPVALSQISPGDVIAFKKNGLCDEHGVVHRVLSCTEIGAITKGDANRSPDPDLVNAATLIGRVDSVKRGKGVYPVAGGYLGRIWSVALHFWWHLTAWLAFPYALLRASGIIRHLWRPPIAHMTLATGQGPVVKYICYGRTVAVWHPDIRSYWCRKPYDLVLDAPGPTTSDREEYSINE